MLETIGSIGTGGSIAALIPGLLLVGGGMGLGITPLATLLLAGLDPEQAGATSGVLATTQNVGNAIGVAVIGVVFFGQLGHGFGHAYAVSSAVLAAFLGAVAALTRLIPAPARASAVR